MPKIFDPYASHISTGHKLLRDPSDPRLHVLSKKVDTHSTKAELLGQLLLRFHFYLNGFGIAAPQIGENYRMFVAKIMPDFPGSTEGESFVFCNPRVVDASPEREYYIEGCLSHPGIRAKVGRPPWIVFEFQKIGSKNKHTIRVEHPMSARILLHETDHCAGHLFTEQPLLRDIEIVNEGQEALIQITKKSHQEGYIDPEV